MENAVYDKMACVEREHWWFVGRIKIIEWVIKKYFGTQPRILDIGCGTGTTTKALSKIAEVWGCDTHELALQHCRAIGGFKTVTPEELKCDIKLCSYYDALCFFDVLEHIKDDRNFVKDYLPFLKNNGSILITVPAFSLFWGNHDVVSHHQRRYTKKALDHVMRSLGFEPIMWTYFNFFLSPLVLVHRVFEGFLSKKSNEGDLNIRSHFMNKLFLFVFSAESSILKTLRFPFGVSFLSLYKKRANSPESV